MVLKGGQGHAGADGHLPGDLINRFQVNQTSQAHHDLSGPRDTAADQSRVAALGDDGHTGIGA